MYRVEVLKQTPPDFLPRADNVHALQLHRCVHSSAHTEHALEQNTPAVTVLAGVEESLRHLQCNDDGAADASKPPRPPVEKSTERSLSESSDKENVANDALKASQTKPALEDTSGADALAALLSPDVGKRPELSSSFSCESNQSIPVLDEYSAKVHVEVARLTPRQREVIQNTFKCLNTRLIKCGMEVMLRLFADYPQYKNIWPQFRQIPDSSLMSAVQLNKHASIYMGGLRTIIENMDDDKNLNRVLRRIAYAHVKWNIYKYHLMNMLQPLLEVIRESAYMDEEVRTSWTTLFDVIANLIDIFRKSEGERYLARR
ncbi:CRE-GLB-14 protein [Aphelenchoides avenae]|nr:CRE-GLB-14 protein [Aphelenchus avenae]